MKDWLWIACKTPVFHAIAPTKEPGFGANFSAVLVCSRECEGLKCSRCRSARTKRLFPALLETATAEPWPFTRATSLSVPTRAIPTGENAVAPKGRNAGWQLYLHYGLNNALARDVRRVGGGRQKSDLAAGNTQLQTQQLCDLRAGRVVLPDSGRPANCDRHFSAVPRPSKSSMERFPHGVRAHHQFLIAVLRYQ